jgi:Tfp pilus assembly protein PilV
MNMILNKFRNCIKENKGFVLVDSMVAVLILAIGLAALAFLYTNGIGTLHKSDTREKAVQIAADWAEVIKTYADTNSKTLTYDDLVSYVDTTLPKDKSGTVTTTTDNETFTVTAAVMDTNYTKYFKASSHSGDSRVVPVSITTTWNNPDKQESTLITYITVSQ